MPLLSKLPSSTAVFAFGWTNNMKNYVSILCVLPHIFWPKHQRPTIINCVARSTPLPIGTLCAYEHFGWNIIIGHHHHQQHEQRWVLCVCAYEHFRVNFKQYFGTRTSSPTMSVGPKPFCIIATRNTVCLRALWARTICRFSIFRQPEWAVDHPHLLSWQSHFLQNQAKVSN